MLHKTMKDFYHCNFRLLKKKYFKQTLLYNPLKAVVYLFLSTLFPNFHSTLQLCAWIKHSKPTASLAMTFYGLLCQVLKSPPWILRSMLKPTVLVNYILELLDFLFCVSSESESNDYVTSSLFESRVLKVAGRCSSTTWVGDFRKAFFPWPVFNWQLV